MPTEGYDLFYEQEKLDKKHCNVCGAKCDVERDIHIEINSMATSMMAKIRGQDHDKFVCPNTNKDWHIKATKLTRERDHTESKYLTEMIQKEIKEVLQNNLNGGDSLE